MVHFYLVVEFTARFMRIIHLHPLLFDDLSFELFLKRRNHQHLLLDVKVHVDDGFRGQAEKCAG